MIKLFDLSRLGWQRLSAWVLTVILLLMPFELMHAVAVIAHTFYEILALGCESVLMHGLGLSKFHAQLIVFYSTLLFGLMLLMAVVRRIPELCRLAWQRCCEQCRNSWRQANVWRKVELVLLQMAGMLTMLLLVLN